MPKTNCSTSDLLYKKQWSMEATNLDSQWPLFTDRTDVLPSNLHFPRYWPFVRGIHRSPVNSPHKGQWRGAFMFSLICAWINRWVNNREAGDLRRYPAHYEVIVMCFGSTPTVSTSAKAVIRKKLCLCRTGPRLREMWSKDVLPLSE